MVREVGTCRTPQGVGNCKRDPVEETTGAADAKANGITLTQGERRVYGRQHSRLSTSGIEQDASPDKGRLGLAARVSEVEDQWQIAIVYRDAGDVDDARNALLGGRTLELLCSCIAGGAYL